MKIITISRTFSKTIQEKDYEPVRIEATWTADVDPDDDPAQVSNAMWENCVNDVGVAISQAIWEKWTNPQKAARKISKTPF